MSIGKNSFLTADLGSGDKWNHLMVNALGCSFVTPKRLKKSCHSDKQYFLVHLSLGNSLFRSLDS